MSDDNGTALFTFNGHYRPCAGCHAPVVVPFPPLWRMTVWRVDEQVYMTPHWPECEGDR